MVKKKKFKTKNIQNPPFSMESIPPFSSQNSSHLFFSLKKKEEKESTPEVFVIDDHFNTFKTPKALKLRTPIFFNVSFDKNTLKTVIAWFLDQYGGKATVDLVETLKQVGFHQATRAGVSLGLEDLQIPPQKASFLSAASVSGVEAAQALETGNLTSVEKSQRLIDTWNKTSESLRQAAVHNFRATNPVNPVYMMAFSGARGNISQVRQLVAMRGLMADPQGAILEFPIQSNFREGLTITEYLLSCYGARKGLVDTALRTASAGYLTRRLVDAVQHVVIYTKNCKTEKGITFKGLHIEQNLLGRVLLKDVILNTTTVIPKDTLVSSSLAKKLAAINQKIFVRSPLTCQTEKTVCQLCYGLDLAQGKLVCFGEAVGIIAAQSIGEPGTQLTMRTFHTGGVGVFSEQAMKSFPAPFDGKIEFQEALPGRFVRTPYGKIVYLLKHTGTNPKQVLLRVVSSSLTMRPLVYEILHQDVPAGSLLWVKQGEDVRTGQLLVQGSRLQKSKQKMPESTHIVRTPFSGELFFEHMPIVSLEKIITRGPRTNPKEEFSPIKVFLKDLGRFWVFSSFIQKQTFSFLDQKKGKANSFFFKGDLVSAETPLSQYNLQIPVRGHLKKLGSSVVLAQTVFKFCFSKIYYFSKFYFLVENQNLIASTTTLNFTSLTWYPFFNQFETSGYYVDLSFSSDSEVLKTTELTKVKSETYDFTKNGGFFTSHQSFVGSTTRVFLLKTFEFFSAASKQTQKTALERLPFVDSMSFSLEKIQLKKQNQKRKENPFFSLEVGKVKRNTQQRLPQFGFMVTCEENSLSRKGIFQIKKAQEKNWSHKKTFQLSFLLNPKKRKKPLKKHFMCSSLFLEKAVKRAQTTFGIQTETKLIEKKFSWFSVSKNFTDFSSQLTGIVLEPGKHMESFSFQHSYVSVNLISRENVFLVKSKTKRSQFSYVLKDLLSSSRFCHKVFEKNFSEQKMESVEKISQIFSSQTESFFSRNNQLLSFFSQKKRIKNKLFFHSQLNFPSKMPRRSDVLNSSKLLFFTREFLSDFSFYKRKELIQKRERKPHTLQNIKVKNKKFLQVIQPCFQLKKKRCLSNLFFLQKLSYQIFPERKFFYETWLNRSSFDFSLPSPFSTKQFKTTGFFSKNELQKASFDFQPSFLSQKISSSSQLTLRGSWVSMTNSFKIHFEVKTPKFFGKIEEFQQKKFFDKKLKFGIQSPSKSLSKALSFGIPIPEFSLAVSRKIIFEKAHTYIFQSFQCRQVLPKVPITQVFLKSKTVGEFQRIQLKNQKGSSSFLRAEDTVTFLLPSLVPKKQSFLKKEEKVLVSCGQRIRWGQEIFPGFASSLSGRILDITATQITVRKALPFLGSRRGLVHVAQNDLLQKNHILMTLRSKQLQTEDIVQGIPKIEQLFEARETKDGEIIRYNMHFRLNSFFSLAKRVKPFLEAFDLSLLYIQRFLVKTLLEAYSNQGVNIAEKHVEVVVRQMTARVRITFGKDTSLLPGEFIQLRLLEEINRSLVEAKKEPALYEPVILGLTKSVLQSESFLLAASFQQVSKVLVRSALATKTDFLRGLHETLILGKPIPAGTGIVKSVFLKDQTPEFMDPEKKISPISIKKQS
nr:RNA polymerase beta'' subunit [Chlorella vulgaris]